MLRWTAAIPPSLSWSAELGAQGAWARSSRVFWVTGGPASGRAVTSRWWSGLAAGAAIPFRRPGRRGVAVRAGDLRHARRSSAAAASRSDFGCVGRVISRTDGASVAIVGSRAATAYGNGIAADLAADLAEQGVTVVSGGAFGIDAAAHRGALAGGADGLRAGQRGRRRLSAGERRPLRRAGPRQLLVSELPPGAHPTRVRFLARNRLIAAMSQGTVVVEAALRSGARNTASWAGAAGR